MRKSKNIVRLDRCLKLFLVLLTFCNLSQMMAMQRAYYLPMQPRKEAILKQNVQSSKNFDLRNNEIALLREVCMVDSADISGEANSLSVEIKKLSLKKLVELRNFTAQQGFSRSDDSCYIRIDTLMDDRLLDKAKDWLKKLMKDHFFSRNDYQEFKRLDISVGEKILKLLWDDLNIKKELLRVAAIYPISGSGSAWKRIWKEIPDNVDITKEGRIIYINKLGSGNNLAGFLRGVKEIYVRGWYNIEDERERKFLEEREQERKLEE